MYDQPAQQRSERRTTSAHCAAEVVQLKDYTQRRHRARLAGGGKLLLNALQIIIYILHTHENIRVDPFITLS